MAGPLAGWSLDVPPLGAPLVTVYHFGPAIGAAGEALVAAALGPALEATPAVRDMRLDSAAVRLAGDRPAWLATLGARLDVGRAVDQAVLCVSGPPADTVDGFADLVRRTVAGSAARAEIVADSAWQHRWTTGRCTVNSAATP